MVASVDTVAFEGIEARPVEVQVLIASGLPSFTIVGLPDKAVTEARERVRAALSALGLALPPKRITVNLSPADRPKEGSHYDLPIAAALLAAMGVLPTDSLSQMVVMGELGLDGSIRSVPGVLPAAIFAHAAECAFVCPATTGAEAAWAGELEVLAPASLLALVNHLKGAQVLSAPEPQLFEADEALPDFNDVKGQETAVWWRKLTKSLIGRAIGVYRSWFRPKVTNSINWTSVLKTSRTVAAVLRGFHHIDHPIFQKSV